MALFEWKDEFSVGLTDIDQQHKTLVDIINRLHDAMKSGQAKTALSGIFNELIEYTNVHFTYEEKRLETNGYPGLLAHKKEHARFVDEIKKKKSDFEAGGTFISAEVFSFLKDWLTQHIMHTDKKYTPFIKK